MGGRVVSFDRKGQTEDLAVPLCWKDRAVGPLDRGRGDQRRAMGVLSNTRQPKIGVKKKISDGKTEIRISDRQETACENRHQMQKNKKRGNMVDILRGTLRMMGRGEKNVFGIRHSGYKGG